MVQLARVLGIAAGALPLVFHLQGCGGAEEPTDAPTTGQSTTTTTTKSDELIIHACEAPRLENGKPVCDRCVKGFTQSESKGACLYKCESELKMEEMVKPAAKGLCVDDTTWHYCPDRLMSFWAHTEERVTSIRLFKAWASWWEPEWKENAWEQLAVFAKENSVKVLLGTEITCHEESDDEDWSNVLQLIKKLGSEYVMGVTIGNELELLWQKTPKQLAVENATMKNECLLKIWKEDYFINKFNSRVSDLDALGKGFDEIKVSSVFGGFILPPNTSKTAFYEQAWLPEIAKVNSFFEDVLPRYKDRYAFTLNIYPYFDPNQYYDEPKTQPPKCSEAQARSLCFPGANSDADPDDCLFTATVGNMRKAMNKSLTSMSLPADDGVLWIGETGWSSPRSGTLDTFMKWCWEWNEKQTQREYYENFLDWDLSLAGERGADHVFYFAMRDSTNFGIPEGFGLVGDGKPEMWCGNTTCKLADVYPGQPTTTPYTGPPTTATTTTTTTTTPTTTTTTLPPPTDCCWGESESCSELRAEAGSCRPDAWCGKTKLACEGDPDGPDGPGGCGGKWCPNPSSGPVVDFADAWDDADATVV